MVPVRLDGFVAPCIPTRASKPPAGPDWVHEIKHDGYRRPTRGRHRAPVRPPDDEALAKVRDRLPPRRAEGGGLPDLAGFPHNGRI
jgi:hypothetical protein